MSVYQAPLDANEAQGQPAGSIGEALSAALTLYKQQSGDEQESGQDDFEAGFSDKPQQTERMQLLVEAASRGALQRFLTDWLPALHAMRRERSAEQRILRWAVDVDPLAI